MNSAGNGRRSIVRLEVPLGIMGLMLVALATAFGATGMPTWIPPAPMVRLGLPSPLTGMTRSFVAIASGDLSAAFAWHPLGPLVFAACIAMPLVAIVSCVRGRRFSVLARSMGSRTLWLGIAFLTALVWARQIVVSP